MREEREEDGYRDNAMQSVNVQNERTIKAMISYGTGDERNRETEKETEKRNRNVYKDMKVNPKQTTGSLPPQSAANTCCNNR